MASQQTQSQYQSFVQPGANVTTGQAQYTQILGADGKPLPTSQHSSEKRHSKEFERSSSKENLKPAGEAEKTPKDVGMRFKMHEDETGRKEIDAKFHFEGKRDKKPEDEEDKDKKSSDHDSHDKAAKAGSIVTKIGDKIQEKAAEKAAQKEPQLEIIEPKNASVHADNGIGTKIVQKIKHKIGEALQDTAAEMLVKNPGDQPRDLEASIKSRLEQANRLEREAFVEEQIANDHNLRRAERKEAKKRAADAKYRATVEVATAEAEKHVLENHNPHTSKPATASY